MEEFFHFFQLNREERLKAAIIGLDEHSRRWFEWEDRPIFQWKELKEQLARSFPSAIDGDGARRSGFGGGPWDGSGDINLVGGEASWCSKGDLEKSILEAVGKPYNISTMLEDNPKINAKGNMVKDPWHDISAEVIDEESRVNLRPTTISGVKHLHGPANFKASCSFNKEKQTVKIPKPNSPPPVGTPNNKPNAIIPQENPYLNPKPNSQLNTIQLTFLPQYIMLPQVLNPTSSVHTHSHEYNLSQNNPNRSFKLNLPDLFRPSKPKTRITHKIFEKGGADCSGSGNGPGIFIGFHGGFAREFGGRPRVLEGDGMPSESACSMDGPDKENLERGSRTSGGPGGGSRGSAGGRNGGSCFVLRQKFSGNLNRLLLLVGLRKKKNLKATSKGILVKCLYDMSAARFFNSHQIDIRPICLATSLSSNKKVYVWAYSNKNLEATSKGIW